MPNPVADDDKRRERTRESEEVKREGKFTLLYFKEREKSRNVGKLAVLLFFIVRLKNLRTFFKDMM